MQRGRDDEDEDDPDYDDSNHRSKKRIKATTPTPSYANLISTIYKIFTNDYYEDYSIDKDPKKLDTETSNGYVFYIREKTNPTKVVSTIVIYVRKSEEKVTPTRKSPSKEITVFHISSLSTNEKHGSKSLAILLYIYAISYLKLNGYSAVEYSTLDDCSNRSTKLDGNIYHILGYVPIDETCLEESLSDIHGEPQTLILSGPEKIADLKVFPQRANDKLDMIIHGLNIMDSQMRDNDSRRGGGKKFTRKSHKRKSHKRKSHKRKSHKGKIYKGKSYKKKLNIL